MQPHVGYNSMSSFNTPYLSGIKAKNEQKIAILDTLKATEATQITPKENETAKLPKGDVQSYLLQQKVQITNTKNSAEENKDDKSEPAEPTE